MSPRYYCPHCDRSLCFIACSTGAYPVSRILTHIGEPLAADRLGAWFACQTRFLNALEECTGSLREGGYKSSTLDTDRYLLARFRICRAKSGPDEGGRYSRELPGLRHLVVRYWQLDHSPLA